MPADGPDNRVPPKIGQKYRFTNPRDHAILISSERTWRVRSRGGETLKTITIDLSAEDLRLIWDALFALDANRYALQPEVYAKERERLHNLWGRLKAEAETKEWRLRV